MSNSPLLSSPLISSPLHQAISATLRIWITSQDVI
jgi:hypothetical protein